MKYLRYIIFLVLLLPVICFAATDVHYVTSSGAGGKTGADMANAFGWTELFTDGNWDVDVDDDNKVGPGDLVCLSGTITPGTSHYYIQGSGSSGNYIEFDGSGEGACAAADQATISRASVSSWWGYFEGSNKSYLDFHDIIFDNSYHTVIYFYENGTDGSAESTYLKFHDLTFNGSSRYLIRLIGVDHVWVYDNTIASTNTLFADGLTIANATNVWAYNNTFSDLSHSGIFINNAHAGNNTSNIYIYNNKFELPNRGYGRAFGIAASYGSVDNFYFYNNWVDGMRTRNQVQGNNYVYIYNNIFSNQKGCCYGAGPWGDPTCTEEGEDPGCAEDQGAGQVLFFQSINGPISHNYIYNNTFYKGIEPGLFFYAQSYSISNIYADNNIFYGMSSDCIYDYGGSTYAGSMGQVNISPNTTTISSWKNNIMLQDAGLAENEVVINNYSGGHNFVRYKVENEDNLNDEAWASGNINDNPDLTDADNDDFSLTSVSPAIDAGLTLNQAYDDAFNPSSALPPNAATTSDQDDFAPWDIGAYIYADLPIPVITDTTNAAPSCPYGTDPINVTFSFTTQVNAYDRISTTNQTWDQMTSSKGMDTGEGTTTHSHVVSLACGQTISYYVAASTEVGDSGAESATTEIEVVIEAEQGIDPPLGVTNLGSGSLGITNLGSGSLTVTIH